MKLYVPPPFVRKPKLNRGPFVREGALIIKKSFRQKVIEMIEALCHICDFSNAVKARLLAEIRARDIDGIVTFIKGLSEEALREAMLDPSTWDPYRKTILPYSNNWIKQIVYSLRRALPPPIDDPDPAKVSPGIYQNPIEDGFAYSEFYQRARGCLEMTVRSGFLPSLISNKSTLECPRSRGGRDYLTSKWLKSLPSSDFKTPTYCDDEIPEVYRQVLALAQVRQLESQRIFDIATAVSDIVSEVRYPLLGTCVIKERGFKYRIPHIPEWHNQIIGDVIGDIGFKVVSFLCPNTFRQQDYTLKTQKGRWKKFYSGDFESATDNITWEVAHAAWDVILSKTDLTEAQKEQYRTLIRRLIGPHEILPEKDVKSYRKDFDFTELEEQEPLSLDAQTVVQKVAIKIDGVPPKRGGIVYRSTKHYWAAIRRQYIRTEAAKIGPINNPNPEKPPLEECKSEPSSPTGSVIVHEDEEQESVRDMLVEAGWGDYFSNAKVFDETHWANDYDTANNRYVREEIERMNNTFLKPPPPGFSNEKFDLRNYLIPPAGADVAYVGIDTGTTKGAMYRKFLDLVLPRVHSHQPLVTTQSVLDYEHKGIVLGSVEDEAQGIWSLTQSTSHSNSKEIMIDVDSVIHCMTRVLSHVRSRRTRRGIHMCYGVSFPCLTFINYVCHAHIPRNQFKITGDDNTSVHYDEESLEILRENHRKCGLIENVPKLVISESAYLHAEAFGFESHADPVGTKVLDGFHLKSIFPIEEGNHFLTTPSTILRVCKRMPESLCYRIYQVLFWKYETVYRKLLSAGVDIFRQPHGNPIFPIEIIGVERPSVIVLDDDLRRILTEMSGISRDLSGIDVAVSAFPSETPAYTVPDIARYARVQTLTQEELSSALKSYAVESQVRNPYPYCGPKKINVDDLCYRLRDLKKVAYQPGQPGSRLIHTSLLGLLGGELWIPNDQRFLPEHYGPKIGWRIGTLVTWLNRFPGKVDTVITLIRRQRKRFQDLGKRVDGIIYVAWEDSSYFTTDNIQSKLFDWAKEKGYQLLSE